MALKGFVFFKSMRALTFTGVQIEIQQEKLRRLQTIFSKAMYFLTTMQKVFSKKKLILKVGINLKVTGSRFELHVLQIVE